MARERWGSRLGIILAVAGSAVGLGNFLRFPALAARNGGGAFMIPYLVALLLLGIPLMWIEWTIGRFGGGFGHSTAPGMFHTLAQKNRFVKYFGVIGIFGPIVIFIYYTWIESWILGYSVFAFSGRYASCQTAESMGAFLQAYQGQGEPGNPYFAGIGTAYLFFLLTWAVNIGVIYFGIKHGIERVCKFGMPLLFVLALILMARVLTLGTPDPELPQQNVVNGLGFLWNPNWMTLRSPTVWLEAAGQIFFTLSVGIGVILTYASYLEKTDDVVLSGLTAASTNEFAEVILGASIVIPAAFIFLGGPATQEVARKGMFNLGFITMPLVLQRMAGARALGFMWFFLLFVAGVTSSISLGQPAVAFLQDEFRMSRRKAAIIFGAVTFVAIHAVIFGPCVLGEMDFWGGTFCLVVFATIETILFVWVFGMDKAWTEMHVGSDLTIPRVYRFIVKYVTPVFLMVILGWWLWNEGLSTMLMKNVDEGDRPYVLATRLGLLIFLLVLCLLVRHAWHRRAGVESGGGSA